MKRVTTLIFALILSLVLVFSLVFSGSASTTKSKVRLAGDFNNPCNYIIANNVKCTSLDGDGSYEILNFCDKVEIFCPISYDEVAVKTKTGFIGIIYYGYVVESGYPLLWINEKGSEVTSDYRANRTTSEEKFIIIGESGNEYYVRDVESEYWYISMDSSAIEIYTNQDQ